MSARWYTSKDAAAAAAACAQHAVAILDEVIAGREFATFAVSGGSTPRLLFERLAAARFPWHRVHLFWVDERSVPPTDPASNYKLADDHLIRPARISPRNVHRILGEIAPKVAAARYTAEIREFFGLEEGEMPHFDLVHNGLGPDAHTASLFPGDPLIDNREDIAAAVFAPQLAQQWRVTLLPGPLLAASHTVFLVDGADKAEAVRAVLQGEYDPRAYPAQIASQARGTKWFLDQAAARLLE